MEDNSIALILCILSIFFSALILFSFFPFYLASWIEVLVMQSITGSVILFAVGSLFYRKLYKSFIINLVKTVLAIFIGGFIWAAIETTNSMITSTFPFTLLVVWQIIVIVGLNKFGGGR